MAEEAQEQETQEEVKEAVVEKKKPAKAKPKTVSASGKVPKEKIEAVKKLAEEMKNSKTIMIISIKGVPSIQLQKIKKSLRGKAVVKVIRKNILLRAIDETSISELAELKEHIDADCAIGLSDEDAFELAGILAENRNPIAAKQGQEATDDIKVEAGLTNLMPGPDISVLGSVGLKVSVEEGKIAIKAPHTILKSGEKVTEAIASILQKLDIKPFMIGLNPTVIYDSTTKKIYVGVKIDKDEALNSLLVAQSKGLGLAQGLKIVTKDTIGYLLAKANAEAMSLEKLAPVEEVKGEAPSETETPVESTTAEPTTENKESEDSQTKSVEETK